MLLSFSLESLEPEAGINMLPGEGEGSSNILFFSFFWYSVQFQHEREVWQQSFSFLLYSVHLQHYDNSDMLSLVQAGLF